MSQSPAALYNRLQQHQPPIRGFRVIDLLRFFLHGVLYFILLFSELAFATEAPSLQSLLVDASVQLPQDLAKTQGYLSQLDALVAQMNDTELEQYVLLKAVYLGQTGQQRQRIALVSQFMPVIIKRGSKGERNVDSQVKLLYQLADAHIHLAEYEQALIEMNHGIRLLPSLTDTKARVLLLQGAVDLMVVMNDYVEAMEYAERIYRLGIDNNDSQFICIGLASKIQVLFKQRKTEEAKAIFRRTVELCKDHNQTFISDTLYGLAAIHLIDIGDYQQGVAQALQTLERLVENPYRAEQINLLHQALAFGYFHLGKQQAAEKHANQVLQSALTKQSSELLKQANLTLARIKGAQGEPTRAISFYEAYIEQEMQFQQEKAARNLAFQRVRYDNLDKTNQLEQLKVKNNALQLRQKLQARSNDNLMLVVLLGAVILLFMTVLLILSLNRKQGSTLSAISGNHSQGPVYAPMVVNKALQDAQNRNVQFCIILFELDSLIELDSMLEEEIYETLYSEIEQICDEHLRQSDHFGRINDHQFVICLLESTVKGAVALAERCRQEINELSIDKVLPISPGATFGVAIIGDDYIDYNEALAAAETALQEAKQRGGDQVYVHHLFAQHDEL